MQLKYCIAKLVDTEPVYLTDTVNTWASDINNQSIDWYASKESAQAALKDPLWYVVTREHIDTHVRVEALTRACESVAEAIRVGAVRGDILTPTLCITGDVMKEADVEIDEEKIGELFVFRISHIHGIPVCAQIRRDDNQ